MSCWNYSGVTAKESVRIGVLLLYRRKMVFPGYMLLAPLVWGRAEEPASVSTLLTNSVSELARVKPGLG